MTEYAKGGIIRSKRLIGTGPDPCDCLIPLAHCAGPSRVVAELVGFPSETDGITIAVGAPGSPTTSVTVEYPMRMVDQQMIALREHAIQVSMQRRSY